MRLAYIRVSTVEQNEQRQIEAMQKYDIEKYFTEKISAKDTNRPKLQELLEFARELNISRPTLDKLIREHESKGE